MSQDVWIYLLSLNRTDNLGFSAPYFPTLSSATGSIGYTVPEKWNALWMWHGKKKNVLARERATDEFCAWRDVGPREATLRKSLSSPWWLSYWRLSFWQLLYVILPHYSASPTARGSFLLSRFQVLLQTAISDNTRKRNFEWRGKLLAVCMMRRMICRSL